MRACACARTRRTASTAAQPHVWRLRLVGLCAGLCGGGRRCWCSDVRSALSLWSSVLLRPSLYVCYAPPGAWWALWERSLVELL